MTDRSLWASHLIEMRDELTPIVNRFLMKCWFLDINREIPRDKRPYIIPNILQIPEYRDAHKRLTDSFLRQAARAQQAKMLQEWSSRTKYTDRFQAWADLDLKSFSNIKQIPDELHGSLIFQWMNTARINPDGESQVVSTEGMTVWDLLQNEQSSLINYAQAWLDDLPLDIQGLYYPPCVANIDSWKTFLEKMNPDWTTATKEDIEKSGLAWAKGQENHLDTAYYMPSNQISFLPRITNSDLHEWDVFIVGEYWSEFAYRLWLATQRFLQMIDEVATTDDIIFIVQESARNMLSRTGRWLDPGACLDDSSVVKKQLREAIVTLTQALAQLTAQKIPWYDDPDILLEHLLFSEFAELPQFGSVVNQMALFSPPASLIGPANRWGFLYKNLIERNLESHKLQITETARKYMKREALEWRERRAWHDTTPSWWRGCPVAFLTPGSEKSAVQNLAEFFWKIFQATKI